MQSEVAWLKLGSIMLLTGMTLVFTSLLIFVTLFVRWTHSSLQ